MLRRLSSGLKNYTTAIENGAADSDYAMFRRAVMYGLGGDIKTKIAELNSLPSLFPGSKWLPNALPEKGQTYAGLGRTEEAVKSFEQLRSSHKQTAQARKGMLNLAIAYMQTKDYDNALGAYREVISKWLHKRGGIACQRRPPPILFFPWRPAGVCGVFEGPSPRLPG